MTCERHERKKEKARELRWLGFSTPQIAKMLAVRSHSTVRDWVADIPIPEWTKRPRAKDDLREIARAMRRDGRSYREIRALVPVSKSTLSLWLKDVPISDEQRALLRQLQVDGRERRATALRARRIATQQRIHSSAAAEIGPLSSRELHLLGVILYWAEGSKDKPWRRDEEVTITNSDEGLILLFLAWLSQLGVGRDRLSFRVAIHETADAEAAIAYWAAVVGVAPDRFLRTQVKRHKPKTNRKNRGEGYRGCLIIRVRRSTELYRQIVGWYRGILDAERVGRMGRSMARGVTGSTGDFDSSSSGSNPDGPASSDPCGPSTLFEPRPPYRTARAS